MKKSTTNVLLAVALVALFAVSFIVGGARTDPEERFTGTDSAATSQIEEANPEYVPWFAPLFQPESGEIESGLFALQAGIGGAVLGFAIGGLWGRRGAPLRDSGAKAASIVPVTTEPTP
ncbi:energy-coupling factor ABC transporter substrate-binding protein [Propionicimonas sp.]|uniref:energy-coupling factor ABC transporter substrate-binding protein n=1 Tax=Propionicimonas sp. TaxID=1955623 RepID=UPI0018010950|nr:energy-coupling factor ABC transporter substrate-binding protein [Propionicimonas sp.]MBU3975380.1 energy-coupling factor ABC transporter substrate-binding protein [Actinomycetota bacterium]MBA3020214.1 energy-coupling factor ABC transporter substrate-binding protein [Propionicimonas sp.]MBU3986471.1 energy-coupling factor ABC transporter substrate-binding protein [Actinomycetota bacterium]MBU4008040.1 energy-coupling factor ABC transporter substrate-binding protein [Actinomycetota bacterium